MEPTIVPKAAFGKREAGFDILDLPTEVSYILGAAKKVREIDFETNGLKVVTTPGIYKLEGETLTICTHPNGRPAGFASKNNDGSVLMILQRVMEK